MITEIEGRKAKILKRHTPDVWRVKFMDNGGLLNVFYASDYMNSKNVD